MTILTEHAPDLPTTEARLTDRLGAHFHDDIRAAAIAILVEQLDPIGDRDAVLNALNIMLDAHDRAERGRVALLHSLLQLEQKIDLYHVNKMLDHGVPTADELIGAFTHLIALAHQHHRSEWAR